MTMTHSEPIPTGILRPKAWRLELPAEITLINANDRMHPAKRSPYIKVIRQAAWAMARHHKIPPLQRAHVFYVVHPDTKGRRRDPGNWSPSSTSSTPTPRADAATPGTGHPLPRLPLTASSMPESSRTTTTPASWAPTPASAPL